MRLQRFLKKMRQGYDWTTPPDDEAVTLQRNESNTEEGDDDGDGD